MTCDLLSMRLIVPGLKLRPNSFPSSAAAQKQSGESSQRQGRSVLAVLAVGQECQNPYVIEGMNGLSNRRARGLVTDARGFSNFLDQTAGRLRLVRPAARGRHHRAGDDLDRSLQGAGAFALLAVTDLVRTHFNHREFVHDSLPRVDKVRMPCAPNSIYGLIGSKRSCRSLLFHPGERSPGISASSACACCNSGRVASTVFVS